MTLRQQLAMFLVALLAVLILAGCAPVAPAAPAAGPAESITGAVVSAATEAAPLDIAALPRDLDTQTAADLAERPDVVILDVREQDEWDAGHIPGALFIPMSQIQGRTSEVPKDKLVIVQCRSGSRSSQVTDYLQGQGFSNVRNLLGGLNGWQAAGLPVEQ